MHEHRSKTTGWLSKVARYCSCCLVVLLGLGAPKSLTAPPSVPDPGFACLATAVYYEARGEPLKGQRAVVDVVIHRAWKSGKNFCEVLTQKQQFQWTKKHAMRYDLDTLLDEVAQHPRVLKNENFLFFHSTSVKPIWAAKMSCKKIGNHYFCKENR